MAAAEAAAAAAAVAGEAAGTAAEGKVVVVSQKNAKGATATRHLNY